jgi:uncharacterized repeat protein (TIGR01451 family)
LARIVGLLILGLFVNRGRALSWPVPACPVQYPGIAPPPAPGEPPLGDSPLPPQAPGSPVPPFAAPPPGAPMPDGTTPFVPRMPFVGPEGAEMPTPIVRLRVRAPAEVQPEKEVEYQLTVENISQAEAHHVTVRDRLPRGTEYVRAKPEPTKKASPKEGVTDLLWDLGTLKPGERKTIVVALQPKGTDEVQNNAYVSFEHGQTIKTRIARPALSLRIVAPPQAVKLPDPIQLRLEVTNTGPLPARNAVLKDELPDGLVFGDSKPPLKGSEKPLTWKLGTIEPGQTQHVELQVIPTKAGTFTNKAEVTADGGVSHKASADIKVGEAKLDVHKSGPRRRMVNRPAPFHITVRNPGTVAVTNVQVSDEVPSGIEFVGASMNGRLQRGFVRWSLGTLRPGDQRSLQLVLRSPQPGRYWNEVSARADHDLTAKFRTEAMHFDAVAGPAVEIDKNADPLTVGQKAIYTIRLINPETTALSNVSLVVTVPDEISVLGQRGNTAGRLDGQTVRFDPLSVLEAGREATYVIEAEAKKAGTAKLIVELVDARRQSGPPQTWEEKTTILDAAQPTFWTTSPPPIPALQVNRTREH